MNIKFYTSHTDYPDYRSLSSQAGRQASPAGKAAGNFDKATFNKAQAPADETSFARVLARETAARIEPFAGQEKVSRLHQQVTEGTYRPDARTIAEHMLGYR